MSAKRQNFKPVQVKGDNTNVIQKLKFVFSRAENIVANEKTAYYQHFCPLHIMFFKCLLSQGRQNSELCGKGLNQI